MPRLKGNTPLGQQPQQDRATYQAVCGRASCSHQKPSQEHKAQQSHARGHEEGGA